MKKKLWMLGLTCLIVFGFSFYHSDPLLAFDMGLERNNMTSYELESIDKIGQDSSQPGDNLELQKNIELGRK